MSQYMLEQNDSDHSRAPRGDGQNPPPRVAPPQLQPPQLVPPLAEKPSANAPISDGEIPAVTADGTISRLSSTPPPVAEEQAPHSPVSQNDLAVDSNVMPPVLNPPAANSVAEVQRPSLLRRAAIFPFWLSARGLDIACLVILLSVVAAIPILQFASLGYLLQAAARLANGRPWKEALPGSRIAGRLGSFVLLATLLWLPVWLVNSLSYSAQLMLPGSTESILWRLAAFSATFLWLAHVGWAAMRGGRWWHVIWPGPIRFITQIWRPATWSKASHQLVDLVAQFHFTSLWWLGVRAAVGALVWIAIPVSFMIIGLRSNAEIAPLFGAVGSVAMILIMLYLPFLQTQVAMQDRFTAIFDIRAVRRRFRFAPLAHAITLLLLCLLSIPLYLLRIEATPAELLWAPSLVFVIFMLPVKLLVGNAMGYAERRRDQDLAPRGWYLRWPSRIIGLASVMIYVGALFVAQIVASQGAYVMYFQHAFLVPAPLISS